MKKNCVFVLLIFLAQLSLLASGFAATPLQCKTAKTLPQFTFEVPSAQDLRDEYQRYVNNDEGNFWSLYLSSFPPEEITAPETVIEYQESKDYQGRMWWIRDGRKIITMSEYVPLKGVHSALVGYLATAEDMRRKGFAEAMLKCMTDETQLQYGEKALGLTLEVENPFLQPEEERPVHEGRVNFYKKLGADIFMENYLMPPLRDEDDFRPMYLMLLPPDGKKEQHSLEVIHSVRDAVHEESYPEYWTVRHLRKPKN